jgi:hypothetical protein
VGKALLHEAEVRGGEGWEGEDGGDELRARFVAVWVGEVGRFGGVAGFGAFGFDGEEVRWGGCRGGEWVRTDIGRHGGQGGVGGKVFIDVNAIDDAGFWLRWRSRLWLRLKLQCLSSWLSLSFRLLRHIRRCHRSWLLLGLRLRPTVGLSAGRLEMPRDILAWLSWSFLSFHAFQRGDCFCGGRGWIM